MEKPDLRTGRLAVLPAALRGSFAVITW